jgi:hypothetical protein
MPCMLIGYPPDHAMILFNLWNLLLRPLFFPQCYLAQWDLCRIQKTCWTWHQSNYSCRFWWQTRSLCWRTDNDYVLDQDQVVTDAALEPAVEVSPARPTACVLGLARDINDLTTNLGQAEAA